MPNLGSFAAVMRDWESLLAAYRAHTELLPDLKDHHALLEQHLQQAKTLKDKQDLEEGLRRKTTQELRAVIDQGREHAIVLRGLVKSYLGRKDKLLAQFGIAPFTPAKRRKTPDVKPLPEEPELEVVAHNPRPAKS